nr:hypothetical protein [Tanacetum cinerariifolium]
MALQNYAIKFLVPLLGNSPDYTTQMAIDYSTAERVGIQSTKESWETIKDLAQYEDEEWDNPIFLEKGNLDNIDATSQHVL